MLRSAAKTGPPDKRRTGMSFDSSWRTISLLSTRDAPLLLETKSQTTASTQTGTDEASVTFRTLTYTLHFLLATFTTRRCLRLVQRLTDKGLVRSLETIGGLERKLDDDVEASVVTRGSTTETKRKLDGELSNVGKQIPPAEDRHPVLPRLEEEEESGQWENSET